ncbi:MAG: DNA polymerase IV [Tannerellaceae bacterium]|nr:DNA polymerase IV [Tannerellaceae bacterium]
MRKIIHIDMDAFYASIEQRDHPEYRNRPLAVGYSGDRGVVAAASYEARKYGVRSAMPSKTALRKCPHLLFVPSRFDVYRSVSHQIMDIFLEYTDLVEPLSLDEAYLDVTVNHKQMPSATLIAREIKQRIKAETGLTASAGVSVNKFLAKIASDFNKPDGLYIILEKDAEEFLDKLPIEQFYGVGKVTAEKMHRLGIHFGKDLRRFPEEDLVRLFGKAGHTYYQNARGMDTREVIAEHIRKSLGAENTFLTDLTNRKELTEALHEVAQTVWERVSSKQFYGRTVTLKVKFSDFEQITRSRTFLHFITDYTTFWSAATELLGLIEDTSKGIRLIGLSISNPKEIETPRYIQLEIPFSFT